jgi:hypothetical protein
MATSLLTGIDATHLLGYAASAALLVLLARTPERKHQAPRVRAAVDALLLVSVASTIHGAVLGQAAFALLNGTLAIIAVSLMIRRADGRSQAIRPDARRSVHGTALAAMHAEIARINADRERALDVMAGLEG